MSAVDDLFEEFIAEHERGGDADPRAYLDRLEGTDRREFAALIDGYLARVPRRAWDRAAYEASREPELVAALARSLQGSSGLWPSLLPRLRARAQIRRNDLVDDLAAALGAQEQREKVESYYHRMEQGRLPAPGVSDRVLEALARILGDGTDTLRRAGRAFGPPPEGTQGQGSAFPRHAPAPEQEELSASAPAHPAPSREDWDEVDRLFLGG